MAISAAAFILAIVPTQEAFTQFTPPPGELVGADRTLVDTLRAELTPHPERTADALVDPRFAHLHAYTEFRELIRDHARDWRMSLVGDDEPGTRLLVAGRLHREDGTGVANALMYAYHTSAKGWYSDKAAHISGNSGDIKHARLFGYLRTDALGRFEIRTIRPGGYPASDLPEHIHVWFEGDHGASLGSEIRFNNDPRMTAEQRVESKRAGYVMVTPMAGNDGMLAVWADFTLK